MTQAPGTGAGSEFEVTVNGEVHLVTPGATVGTLVAAVCTHERGVAVAVDGLVVPHSEWAAARLEPGAAVEIVTAAAGG